MTYQCLFTDDIIIFYRGNKAYIVALIKIFERYTLAFGQISTGSSLPCMLVQFWMLDYTMFQIYLGSSMAPFLLNYLGVSIFKGMPIIFYLKPLADTFIHKLRSWKGSLLSYVDMIQLVWGTILPMLVHYFFVFSWSVSLLKNLDRSIKNSFGREKLTSLGW